jgi:hypothetical protein
MNIDEENNHDGCLSKLFACEKIFIIYQVQSGRLETTAQAIYFINSILSHHIHPKTVKRAL